MSHIHIRSSYSPNVYVRLDGKGVNQGLSKGGGIVNCQFGAGSYEVFKLVNNPDDTLSIESVEFPNVFLRMDGSEVTGPSVAGQGKVNAQCTAGVWEKFKLVINNDGTSALKSNFFDKAFLRIDGNGLTARVPEGGGTVNCQFSVGSLEKLIIRPAVMQDQVNAAIDKLIQSFPQQAAMITARRQQIMEACRPPFTVPLLPLPIRSLPNLTDVTVKEIVMTVIGIALSVAGVRLGSGALQAIYLALPDDDELGAVSLAILELGVAWHAGVRERTMAAFKVLRQIWAIDGIIKIVWNGINEEMSGPDGITSGAVALAIITDWVDSDGTGFYAVAGPLLAQIN